MNSLLNQEKDIVHYSSRNGHNSRIGAPDAESVVDLLHLDEAGQHQLVLHLDQEHHLGLISMGYTDHLATLISCDGRGYPPW